MAVYCHHCGTGLPPSARFCSSCGTTIPFNPVAQHMPGRPLVRPRVGRQIAGVCLALALANGWDVAVVRIVTVLGFVFSGGFVGIAYLAGWIGIPEEPLSLPGATPGPYPGANSGAYPPGI
ncbi:MAG: PspC domain-containing protein [Terracidiphilus sp.]|nr:PspC domain-containing protein [Terracidiphilus sp.]